jgi:hypothetical protein
MTVDDRQDNRPPSIVRYFSKPLFDLTDAIPSSLLRIFSRVQDSSMRIAEAPNQLPC